MTDQEIKKFRNLEPGKTFKLRSRKIIISEGTGDCEGCLYKGKNTCQFLMMAAIIPECNGNYREDGKYVIFKEVEYESK